MKAASLVDLLFLTAVLEAMPMPSVVVAADLRILAANAAARDLFPALLPGHPLVMVLRDPNVHDAVREVVAGSSRRRVVWRDRVPVERVFDVCVAPVDRPGEPPMVALTLDDLTEAHRIDRMRADFVANASHELRTPLASLLGFIETLQGPARDDARARATFLAVMAEQARRMARLIDDLLSLSRIEQRRHIRPCTPVDLSGVVRHVAETLLPLAQEQAAEIDLHIDAHVTVPGDRDELVRVAENLIENAIKYGRRDMPDMPARVAVSLGSRRNEAIFEVRDAGDGIAPEHLPRLTERFYRIDAHQSRAKGGTGLGLALVKHVVAHHRGRLEIDSVVGQGSTFRVLLPAIEKPVI